MAKFKPHIMYSKAGKPVKVTTNAKHLELKKKGYTHSKPKKKWWEIKSVLGVEKRSQPVAVCTNEFLGSIR